jgi:hypothetical protein
MNSGRLARGTGRGPERAESVMVFGGRPLAVPSGAIKCDDLPQLGLKVSILIDLLAWIGWSAVLRIGEGMSDATTAIAEHNS